MVANCNPTPHDLVPCGRYTARSTTGRTKQAHLAIVPAWLCKQSSSSQPRDATLAATETHRSICLLRKTRFIALRGGWIRRLGYRPSGSDSRQGTAILLTSFEACRSRSYCNTHLSFLYNGDGGSCEAKVCLFQQISQPVL